MQRLSSLSGWAQCHLNGPYKREAEGSGSEKEMGYDGSRGRGVVAVSHAMWTPEKGKEAILP